MTKIDESIILKQFQVNELSDSPKLCMIMDAQQMKSFKIFSIELEILNYQLFNNIKYTNKSILIKSRHKITIFNFQNFFSFIIKFF